MHFHARFIYQKCISSDVLDELFLENVKDVVEGFRLLGLLTEPKSNLNFPLGYIKTDQRFQRRLGSRSFFVSTKSFKRAVHRSWV